MCTVIIAVTIPSALHKLYCIHFEYVCSYPNNNWDIQHYLRHVLKICPSMRMHIFSDPFIGQVVPDLLTDVMPLSRRIEHSGLHHLAAKGTAFRRNSRTTVRTSDVHPVRVSQLQPQFAWF